MVIPFYKTEASILLRAVSLEKTLLLGRIEGRRRRGNRGWSGWMASLTQWTWVWASSGRYWRTGKPGVRQSIGLQSQTQLSDWKTRASLAAPIVKSLPAVQESQLRSLGPDNALEKGMATQSSILAWIIPWTEGPGGLQSIRLHRVGHDWATNSILLLILLHPHLYFRPLFGVKIFLLYSLLVS